MGEHVDDKAEEGLFESDGELGGEGECGEGDLGDGVEVMFVHGWLFGCFVNLPPSHDERQECGCGVVHVDVEFVVVVGGAEEFYEEEVVEDDC